jgi:5-methyltetrahydropteroyltriglutamate--homocysteine methyltransferase
MTIRTEPIGSIPRPPELLALLREFRAGRIAPERLAAASEAALRGVSRKPRSLKRQRGSGQMP